jgi:6-phosphogluconolactonase
MATDGAASDAGSKKKLLIFDSEEDLAVSLAKYTAELSEKFASERGAFTAVVSGGSLIEALRFFNFPSTLRDWLLSWVIRGTK